MIINISYDNIEVIKIQDLNKENVQYFKIKYCKKQKYLIRLLNKDKSNKSKIIELITDFLEEVLDNSIEIVTKLKEELGNIT